MCGIVGLLHLDGRSVDPAVLTRMTDVLAHRGPDGQDIWLGEAVGFGHRRLAIRDLTSAGRQPMSDPSGRITVTYNGEIYNDTRPRRSPGWSTISTGKLRTKAPDLCCC